MDPNGTGSRNFTSLASASFQLFSQGVSGPVTIEIAPGTHLESWSLAPITGASATNRIRFKSKTALGARLGSPSSQASYIVFIGDFGEKMVTWISFEGIEFFRTSTNTVHTAIRATGICSDFEIINSKFSGTHISCGGYQSRWNIHHSLFVSASGGECCRFGTAEGLDIHHNEFQLEYAHSSPVSIEGYSGSSLRNRIYNNLIWGTVSSGGSALLAGFHTDVDHNSILFESGTGTGACVYVYGAFGMHSEIHNNILFNLGSGPAMLVPQEYWPFEYFTDGNLYWAPNSTSGLIAQASTSNHYSLAAWQTFSGQDMNSLSADPMFVNSSTPPYDLKLKDGSPAAAKAFNTRSWITDDFAGNPRPAKASIGAYEGKPPLPPTTFTVFGQGCPGTGSIVPSMGYSGDLKLGSSNFSVTVKNTVGGAFVRAFFAIGASKTLWNGIPLPINLGGSCNLLVAPHIVFPYAVSGPAGAGNGSASVLLGIPNDPKLKGVLLHFQWAIVDPAAAGMGLAFSDAATLQI